MNPNQPLRVIGVIPGRYASSRFPGKIIAPIAGKPMIQRVYEQCHKSKLLDDLLVAVDDQRVFDCVQGFGGKVVMTGTHHQSGTDRIAEAVADIPTEIVVNIQGDHPLLDPVMIDEAVQPLFDHPDIPMSTLKSRITQLADFTNPNVVKVVVDENDRALYFSRSLIPCARNQQQQTEIPVYEHLGIYVYRKDFLLQFSQWPPSHLEQVEMLEQLRVLEKGYPMIVKETHSEHVKRGSLCVDTPEDLLRVEQYIRENEWE